MSRRNWFVIGATTVVAIGLLPAPLDLWTPPGIAMALLCLFPALLAVIHVTTSLRLHPIAATLLMVITIAVGSVVTAGVAVFGTGSLMTVAAGIALVLGITGMLRHMEHGTGQSRVAIGTLALAGLAGAWSLVSGVVAVTSAAVIAGESPYCLAHHGALGPVESLAALRGLSFYTTETGYKSTSRWYLHGILTVTGPDGDSYFNWSPRRLRFDPLPNPERLIASPLDHCAPIPGFLRTLPLWSLVPRSPAAPSML